MIKQTLFQLIQHPAKIAVFVFYVIGSLVFGEFHPFSKFPMYSTFPNWSYTFFLQNERGDTLFWSKELKISAGNVAHMYYSICQYQNIGYGYGMESAAELETVGNLIMKEVTKDPTIDSDTLILLRKFFSVQADSINEQTTILCKYHAE